MSVAGILAAGLFSGAGTQFTQKAPLSSVNTSSDSSSFAALQQKLSQSSAAAPASASTVSSELNQLGQDLDSGKLASAQADYSALKITLAQHHAQLNGQSGLGSAAGENSSTQASQSGNIANPLAAAMLAYSSLQQNPNNGAASSSSITSGNTFSINA